MRTALFALTVVCILSSAAHAQEPVQWAPSAGFMLGELNSNELASVGTLVDQMTGYNSALTGRSWDLCAAHGRSGSGQSRICYTQVRLGDGSRLSDEVTEGQTEAVVVKGFKVERLWRIGPRSWRVAPAIGFHGGLGKVSGAVLLTEYDAVFDPRTGELRRGRAMASERRPASEILGLVGRDWTLIAGANVGATATLSRHMTINVGVYGLEMPGVYKGQIQFVYWPR